MKKILPVAFAILLAVGLFGVVGPARPVPKSKPFAHITDEDATTFTARLRGLNEVPPVATSATGSFSATLSADGTTLTYTVSYSNLNAPILFSHIHFGFPREATGIMVFLCGPAAGAMGGPPAGTPDPPACAAGTSGTVTGSVTAANVIGPNAQGITPGADFAKVVQSLREGAAYVNVHTVRSPSGEVRGQVRGGSGEDN